MKALQVTTDKSIFFASDFHLGAPNSELSREREKKIVRWLDSIQEEAGMIFLVGDIFDFWFEYRHAIPKGYVRFLGKLAELRDAGIPIIFFSGNHDMWMFDYFPQELDIPIYRNPQSWLINGTSFLVGHGDGLGPGDHVYKVIKKVFRNPLSQWLFARLHPNFGIGLASSLSRRSRSMKDGKEDEYLGDEEWLVQYCHTIEKKTHYDYYIFGHRHLPLDVRLNAQSRYINTGDWIKFFTYACFDGKNLELKTFESQ